jgi:2,3-bisphosphoglycerate-independent phosphoglycerate mutase
VLDGWGIAPDGPANAVTRAKTPRLDKLFARYPDARLEASGRAVGLPDGVMGNSEVGHLTMGAGYIQYQELVRINDAIEDGSFYRNEALVAACRAAKRGGTLHLLGLLSTGGVHADLAHLDALVELARREGVERLAYHCFLDGRDMPPRSALELLPKVHARIATVHGRYWAMDRDKRWDRTQRSWEAIVDAEGPRVRSAEVAVNACYARAECRDELLSPCVVGDGAPVQDGEAVIFFNFRPDRARQLTLAFMQEGFEGFPIARRPKPSCYVTMTDYKIDLPKVSIAFEKQDVTPLARILAERGLRQFHCAETEKYAHVTYFFNGGHEEPFTGENRVLVPSPKVATYDLQPEMSAEDVALMTAKAIHSEKYDFVVVNFANPDMVGHTGDLPATLLAMQVTDSAVGTVVDAALATGGAMLITGDHGNAEELRFPDGSVNTQHSMNPVPVILVGAGLEDATLRDGGLRDVAPTILDLMDLPIGAQMTGRTLIEARGR